MAITFKTAGTYTNLTSSGVVVIPGSPAADDRMFLFATWKPYTVTQTAPAGWTAIGSEYADGTVGSGVGTGSMKVQAWYRDWQSGDANPTIPTSGGSLDGGSGVILIFSKDSGDTWGTPLTANAAWPSSSSQTVSATSTVAVPNSSVVMSLVGFADDIFAITRSATALDVATGITWAADYVEAPATHFSSALAADSSADLGYRYVTTGGTVTLRTTATLTTAETGAVKFVAQGITAGGGGGGGATGSGFFLW